MDCMSLEIEWAHPRCFAISMKVHCHTKIQNGVLLTSKFHILLIKELSYYFHTKNAKIIVNKFILKVKQTVESDTM